MLPCASWASKHLVYEVDWIVARHPSALASHCDAARAELVSEQRACARKGDVPSTNNCTN